MEKSECMTEEQFSDLRRGDIVRNLGSGSAYVIEGNATRGFIGIKTIRITHRPEWMLFSKSVQVEQEPTNGTD